MEHYGTTCLFLETFFVLTCCTVADRPDVAKQTSNTWTWAKQRCHVRASHVFPRQTPTDKTSEAASTGTGRESVRLASGQPLSDWQDSLTCSFNMMNTQRNNTHRSEHDRTKQVLSFMSIDLLPRTR